MRSVGFYALGNAWLFALLAPLVLFYFLKLKRPRLEVPSLVLWRQVLRDNRVNSPFQRFKRNLLLLLQVLLLMLLAAGAMQPFWRQRAARVRRIPVLIDTSASMAALDKPRGSSRMGVAKKEVEQIIDGLLPDQEMCLISFSRTARRRCDFTSNKRVLRDALDGIQVEDVPSDVEDALRLTQALAQGAAFDEVLLFSDGNLPIRAHFELPFALHYQQIPPAGPNFGIGSLNARRSAEGHWDVFVLVDASADAAGSVAVELRQDDRVLHTEYTPVQKGKGRRMVFRVGGDRASALEVGLIPEGFDSLGSDNVAFLALPAIRPLQVYVPEGAQAYRHALAALDGLELHAEGAPGYTARAYDLVVTDREADLPIEGRTSCYVGVVPEDLRELVSVEQAGAQIVDWQRSARLLQHAELADLAIFDRPRSAEGVRTDNYESLGYEVLADGDGGPLILQKQEGDRLLFFFLFHTDRSSLPYRVGFPVIVRNLAQIAMEQAGLAEAQSVKTGVLPGLTVRPGRTCEVRGPDGRARTQQSGPDGLLSGLAAPRVGLYQVFESGQLRARVGASLLASSETVLERVEELEFDEGLSVAASTAGPRADRSLWPMFAMLAFCVLAGEWWYFHRRPGGGVR